MLYSNRLNGTCTCTKPRRTSDIQKPININKAECLAFFSFSTIWVSAFLLGMEGEEGRRSLSHCATASKPPGWTRPQRCALLPMHTPSSAPSEATSFQPTRSLFRRLCPLRGTFSSRLPRGGCWTSSWLPTSSWLIARSWTKSGACAGPWLLVYFISTTAVTKLSVWASKAAGVFDFFAIIVFAVDFYLFLMTCPNSSDKGTPQMMPLPTRQKNSHTDSDLRPASALASQATRLSLLHPANRLAGLAWPGNCECWEGSSDFSRSSRGSRWRRGPPHSPKVMFLSLAHKMTPLGLALSNHSERERILNVLPLLISVPQTLKSFNLSVKTSTGEQSS